MPQALSQVNAAARTGPSDPSQAFSPSFGTVARLTPLVAGSTQIPHAVSLATSYNCDERGGNSGTPHSVISTSSSSRGYTNIYLIQRMLDKVARQKYYSRNILQNEG